MNKLTCSLALLSLTCTAAAQTPYPAPQPSPLDGLTYAESIYPAGADHDPAIPAPDTVLGFAVGQRTATPEQIVAYAKAIAAASDRVQLVEYAQSYEGRPLVYLAISSPANLARSAGIQRGMAALADPRGLDAARRAQLIESTPGIAWLAYSIHGNESSGSDASLALMYHLAADRSAATRTLLDELVVIVDPSQNPDGRGRFVKGLAENRGTQPSVDDQSVLHTGYWPFGRGNHYLFDLNRDWIYGRHPETRGRIAEMVRWKPLLVVDIHEMGSQDTHLFSPGREPYNPNHPAYMQAWGQLFANDQARAFDRYGYPYYSGEWNEEWYPGYTGSWAWLKGANGILYEQARIAEDGVQRPTHLLSYQQSVHHQLISSFANLETLRRERRHMLDTFATDRAGVTSARGPYANRSFVILPTGNGGRLNDLLDLIRLQGFEAHRATRSLKVSSATDQLGRELRNFEVPAGSIVLRNRQPEARLLAENPKLKSRYHDFRRRESASAVSSTDRARCSAARTTSVRCTIRSARTRAASSSSSASRRVLATKSWRSLSIQRAWRSSSGRRCKDSSSSSMISSRSIRGDEDSGMLGAVDTMSIARRRSVSASPT